MSSSRIRLTHDAYRVGWISALPLEMAAAIAMLDASHAPLPQPKGDHNTYHLGEIGDHNIVIACLPTGIYGLTSAAVVAQQMLSTFPSIDIGLMVGIGGGVPSASVDVRLGDVVVSKPTGQFPGVIQYDYGKTVADGSFHRTGSLNNPPERLLTAVSVLQAKHKMGDNNIALHLSGAAKARPSMQATFMYPGESEDILFESSHVHEADRPSCGTCDKTKTVSRSERDSKVPRIYYGLIASANQVMKDALTRDRLGEELGILCFEMEAAGLMNHFPCLVIRGICDYSDSHKNKQWQDYAAGTAAAYARELLQLSVPSTATPAKKADVIRIRSKIPISKSVFFGREAELEQVREALNVTNPARQFAVIWGLSGYGKTQLAIEYLTSRDDDYDSILWIDSSSRGMAEESFEQISLRLGPPTSPRQSGAERVIEWLEQDVNRSWVIVFDGVESLDDSDMIDSFDIRDYFPACKHGHLLLVTTSPDLHLRLAFPGIQVQGVDDQMGADILLRCARARSRDSASHNVAMTISRKLGGMPLAIEQAGSYLSYGLTSMSDYNKNFQVRFMDRTLKTPMRKYVGSYEKGRTLWTTFDMLYEALQRKSADSARVLRLIAFLGRGVMPFTVIVGKKEDQEGIFGVTDEPQPRGHVSFLPSWLIVLRSEPMVLANIVEELEASGFVKFHRKEGDIIIESVVLHDLARSFLQSKVSPDEAVDMVATSFLLNGWQLYDGTRIPEQNVIRRHMGRLVVVLELFISQVPNAMLQPPDGKYFRLCASVAPLYARICRYSGSLDTAAKLWSLVLQHRVLYDQEGTHRSDQHHEDLMEAAEVDSRLGNLAGAIDKYSAVISFLQSSNRGEEETCIKAAGLLRESHERLRRREGDSGRAIAAVSRPKNTRRGRDGDKEEEKEEDEEELLAIFGEHRRKGLREALVSAQRLCSYYQRHKLPQREAEYWEFLWTNNEEEHGGEDVRTTKAFEGLCDCYYAIGELGTKMVGDLHFALTWAKAFRSEALIDLLSAESGPAVLESLGLGELQVITTLIRRREMDTAFCCASLQPTLVRDKLLQYLATKLIDHERLLIELVRRPWSGAAIDFLLKSKTHGIDHVNIDLKVLFSLALLADNRSGVLVLLTHGALEYQNYGFGTTPIHLAAGAGFSTMIQLLCEHGASVSQPDANGRTPLHDAAAKGSGMATRTLIALGANVWETDIEGITPLHLAVRGLSQSGLSVVQVLLKHGASVTHEDYFGRTAFHHAAAAWSANGRTVQLLIQHYQTETEESSGFPHGIAEVLNIQDYKGRTALHEALNVGNRDVYKLLVHAGANPDILDHNGVSAAFEWGTMDEEELASLALEDIHERDHGSVSDEEQRLGEPEMSRPASGNGDDSIAQSHEQPAHHAGTRPAKTEDGGPRMVGEERTGWRTRWRHWRESSVPFRASRGQE